VKVLVTRPQPQSDDTIGRLAARGIEGIAAPLMRIETVAAALPADAAAIALTSSNAVRALTDQPDCRALMGVPVFAVGERTAAAARTAGFGDVRSAGGDVDSLVRLVASSLPPNAGRIVYASGRDVAGDLEGRLAAAGLNVERIVVYEAVAATALPEPARHMLAAGDIGAVLLYSPRSARIFAALSMRAGISLEDTIAVAMSDAVAEAAGQAGFAAVAVAARPEQGELIAALERFVKARGRD
jgi:uroporphyrinogen-III synthase